MDMTEKLGELAALRKRREFARSHPQAGLDDGTGNIEALLQELVEYLLPLASASEVSKAAPAPAEEADEKAEPEAEEKLEERSARGRGRR